MKLQKLILISVSLMSLFVVVTVNAASVSIVSPASETTVTKGEIVVLEADVSASADGGRSLIWYSNLNGMLGRGGYVETSELSAGRHVISLSDTSQSATNRSQQIIINVAQ